MFVIYIDNNHNLHGESIVYMSKNEYSNWNMSYIHKNKLKNRYVSDNQVLVIFDDDEEGYEFMANEISNKTKTPITYAKDSDIKKYN